MASPVDGWPPPTGWSTSCPDCGTPLSGGWAHRTREVIDLPRVPAQVTEHVFIARVCPRCRRNCLPSAELDRAALGKQRLGVNLVSLIATLREEGRLPIRSIQWYLRTVHQLRLSVGAIVAATQRTAEKARPAVAGILERIRGSPVVHADETGWRENGANGYVWTFSTPTDRYFLRRGRGKSVVDEVLGDGFAGVLVCDFYAAYHHYDGPKQRCWVHLLRDIHDLRGLSTPMTAGWPSGPKPSMGFTLRPKPSPIPRKSSGAPHNRPGNSASWPSAVPSWMTARQPRPSCAVASSATSRNSSSSWANRRRRRTTTPPSAACVTWS